MSQLDQFSQNLAIGKQGEWQMIIFFICLGFTQVKSEDVYQYQLKRQDYPLIVDVSNRPDYQKQEIDILLYYDPDQCSISVEVKKQPSALKYGNLFFQITNHRGDPGWGDKSNADYFAFIVPDSEILLVKRSKLLALTRKHQFQLKTMNNGEEGLLIPVSEVRNICDPDKRIPIPKLA
ncbi:hypothetical protein PL11201_670024 [Planktothrix sp. PCC 11201]|uniref:hypothetical protein n=1 Tax=Planktothrix sp. PCC 11201 TaxID=1729650 RepID=UPI00091D4732|nr:hypothetical protein [Planktothrix sp. PCC 11201]SKB14638.1 hypothetical protein PL11201_670024 [Planktothrix sp. PCC 11201]